MVFLKPMSFWKKGSFRNILGLQKLCIQMVCLDEFTFKQIENQRRQRLSSEYAAARTYGFIRRNWREKYRPSENLPGMNRGEATLA